MLIKLRQIKVDIVNDSEENLLNKIASKLRISKNEIIDYNIEKKSIDARDKSRIFYVYEVKVFLKDEKKFSNYENVTDELYQLPECGNDRLINRPIIVGAGPSGLFCALVLAEKGFKPLIIERGEKMDERIKTVQKFWDSNVLLKNSNVCFGEGGAGTFSDGKLNTLVKDENNRIKKVFKTFVECGANEDIMYVNKPHIGTDVLRDVIVNLRNKIISLGGEFLFNSCLTDVEIKSGKIQSVTVNNKEKVECDVAVFAIGHSARDTIMMLYNKNISMKSKPFAVGLRVQHKQKMINENQYGKFSRYLKPASYKLTYKSSNQRGVYTFCMCPGGYVVNSSSEEGLLLVNGMSNYNRDSENANSAVVVTVGSDDFGNNALDGIKFQNELEKKAFIIGGGKIPVQLYKDYKIGIVSNHFGKISPVIKGDYTFANLNEIFPSYINDSIKEAIEEWNKKINGFSDGDVILAGVESRTSSAVRIERNEKYLSNIDGVYPCGEGAGYSGGITTSSVDGIKVAEEIVKRYSNKYINV